MVMSRSLGDVFCETVKSLGQVQRRVLLKPSKDNPMKECKDPTRPKIDHEVSPQKKPEHGK